MPTPPPGQHPGYRSTDPWPDPRTPTRRATGERYADDEYASGRYAGDPYAGDPYAGDPYTEGRHAGDPYTSGGHTGGGYAADDYAAAREPGDAWPDRWAAGGSGPAGDPYGWTGSTADRWPAPDPEPRPEPDPWPPPRAHGSGGPEAARHGTTGGWPSRPEPADRGTSAWAFEEHPGTPPAHADRYPRDDADPAGHLRVPEPDRYPRDRAPAGAAWPPLADRTDPAWEPAGQPVRDLPRPGWEPVREPPRPDPRPVAEPLGPGAWEPVGEPPVGERYRAERPRPADPGDSRWNSGGYPDPEPPWSDRPTDPPDRSGPPRRAHRRRAGYEPAEPDDQPASPPAPPGDQWPPADRSRPARHGSAAWTPLPEQRAPDRAGTALTAAETELLAGLPAQLSHAGPAIAGRPSTVGSIGMDGRLATADLAGPPPATDPGRSTGPSRSAGPGTRVPRPRGDRAVPPTTDPPGPARVIHRRGRWAAVAGAVAVAILGAAAGYQTLRPTASPRSTGSGAAIPSASPLAPSALATGNVPATGSGKFSYATGTGPKLGAASGAVRTFKVAVENGSGQDLGQFSTAIERILADPHGWTAGGQVRFQRVSQSTSASFTIYLATPATADSMCAAGGLHVQKAISCRLPGKVIINLARWVNGTPGYGAPLTAYQAFALNHEVGRELGYGNQACPGPRQLAPVMQQQTLGLGECTANPWPYPNGTLYQGRPIP